MALNTPLSLLWSILACSIALFVLASDFRAAANRALGRFFMVVAWWGFCEFLWNNAASPEYALRWLYIGMPGYLPIGGLYLLVALNLTDHGSLAQRWWVSLFAYGVPLSIGTAVLAGYPLYDELTRMPWGWAYHPAPLFTICVIHMALCFAGGLLANFIYLRNATTPRVRRKAHLLLVACVVPIVSGFLTDAVLPVLGIQLFRVASFSITVMLGIFIYAMVVYREPLVSAQRFSSEIISTIPDALFLIDPYGKLLHTNAAAVRLTGVPRERLQEMSIAELIEIPAETTPEPGAVAGGFSDLRNAEVLLRTRNGERVPVALSTSSIVDKRGDFLGLVGVARDLSSYRQLQRQVARSDKLAAVGKLASAIGHEINNPITYVSMNLRTLRREIEAIEKLEGADDIADSLRQHLGQMRELLEESAEGAARIHEIVHNMRQFSNTGSGKIGRTRLQGEIENALRVADPEIKHRAKLHLEVENLPSVMANASELQQVLVNLLINSTCAMSDYGNVWIRTFRDKGWAGVEVEDDGTGIDPEILPHIFDPCFTTKDTVTGAGLGLAISYQILERMGGRISVRPGAKRGSVFRVELPLAPV